MLALEASVASLDWGSEESSGHSAARSRPKLADGPAAPAASWQDKLQAVPAIRSALIPLDDADEGWSKPFSLVKADFEPWTSYYSGYLASRLFLQAGGRSTPVLDFPLQALLELKNVDLRFLIEPPVCIDGPVEYFDASRAGNGRREPGLAASLERAAEATHRSQLKRAQERGRQMGDALHDALLGDGLSNLIRAWEKRHCRKPSPHELHLMLTTGRVQVVDSPASLAPPSAAPAPASAAAAPAVSSARGARERSGSSGSNSPLPSAARPVARAATSAEESTKPAPAPVEAVTPQPEEVSRPGRIGLQYLLHIAGAAGIAALTYLFMWR